MTQDKRKLEKILLKLIVIVEDIAYEQSCREFSGENWGYQITKELEELKKEFNL